MQGAEHDDGGAEKSRNAAVNNDNPYGSISSNSVPLVKQSSCSYTNPSNLEVSQCSSQQGTAVAQRKRALAGTHGSVDQTVASTTGSGLGGTLSAQNSEFLISYKTNRSLLRLPGCVLAALQRFCVYEIKLTFRDRRGHT